MLDTETMSRLVWQQAAQDVGYEITPELFLRLIGRTREDCELVLQEAWGTGFSIGAMRERVVLHWEQRVAQDGIVHKTGLIELVDFLDSTGLKKAVATSSRRENALGKLGSLADRFDFLVTGDEVARGKPAPDIFLLAARRLDVEARQCLVLEDSPAGMQAAEAAGMYAIMVPDLVPAPEGVSHTCTSLFEVRAWLKNHSEAD